MDRQDFMGLYESYMGVYEQDEYIEEDVEEIDEARAEENLAPTEKQVIRNKRLSGNPFSSNASSTRSDRMRGTALRQAIHSAGRGVKRMPKGSKENYDITPVSQYERSSRNESYDLYDLVLEYLLDEGLCESVENAEIMMAHMSEEWVDAIVESYELDEELTGSRREYAIRRAEELRNMASASGGYRKTQGRKREIAQNMSNKAQDLLHLTFNTRGRGWENQPTKLGGSGRKGEPKDMDYGVDHSRSQKSPKELLKSKLRKRALRDINRK